MIRESDTYGTVLPQFLAYSPRNICLKSLEFYDAGYTALHIIYEYFFKSFKKCKTNIEDTVQK